LDFPEMVAIDENGQLAVAGVNLVDLARRFGTPLYVYDADLIRRNCRSYRDLLLKYYPEGEIAYAGKAFLTMAMCRLLQQEGLSLDVVSEGELFLARSAGFPPERIYFHGNNKSAAELKAAVEWGVGRVVVDNLAELEELAREAERQRRSVSILLRIKPGISPHTHRHIQTGQIDSKFGLGIADGQAMAAVKKALQSPRLNLRGLHCHIGSQILDPQPFVLAAGIMVALLQEIRRKTGAVLPELNLGGGLGIRYTSADRRCSIGDFLQLLTRAVIDRAGECDFPLPKLILEPGRSIVGEAGLTLYTIGTVKEIPGGRRYVAVDGGMSDNLRPALYGARYEAALANRPAAGERQTVSIAGKACESGDILIKDIELPAPRSGDLLAVFSTGAYHFSMFSHYNRHLRPAVVFLSQGRAELVVRRESLADLTRLEQIPPSLEAPAASRAEGA